jgi:arylsulfatase A-like enzyme/Flp pilus assembly protein TadD
MSKRRLAFVAVPLGVLAVAAAIFVLLRPRNTDFARLRKGKDFNVILITLDTTRADRLGCYGFTEVETPTLDMFASRGVMFKKCYSTTPLTLPAHTSIMTGTLPPFHGVRDNGGFIVPPEIKTMAELFKDKGYATSAFVAAYVLDSKWGLNQGFDTYYDNFDLSKFEKVSLGSVQRPANQVIDQVLPWLEKNKTGRFFTWIHLYDPHSPYEPPPPYDRRYAAHPYLGEIAFTDSQLARVWDFLEANGLADDSFLVVAGDHGESLGEHEETGHGFFVYQAAIHVPLIFVTPFRSLQGRSSDRVSSLADILPTVCGMTGLSAPGRIQGESLIPAFDGRAKGTPPLAYSETYYPRFHYGWSELRSVQNDRYKLILAPVPELYDVINDPGEDKNLVYLEKQVYKTMSAEAERYIVKLDKNGYELDFAKIDEETREKLAALGYVGSFNDPSKLKGRKLANPREKIGIFNELSRAREIGMSGQAEEAIGIIKRIIASDPEITDAYFALGNIYFKERRFEEAIAAFRVSLEKKPDDSFAVINIANSYAATKRFDEAENFVLDHFKRGFSDPQLYYLLGSLCVLQKKYDKAAGYFQECLARNAESAASHSALGAIYIEKDDTAQAESHVRAALEINPELTGVHYNLAQILEKQGRDGEAEEAYKEEVRLSPGHFKSMYNLSRLYRRAGNEAMELEYLNKCVAAEPSFPLSYFYLARISLNHSEQLEAAVALVLKGIELKPDPADLPLGYFLLADLYNRLGQSRLAEINARKGRELAASR